MKTVDREKLWEEYQKKCEELGLNYSDADGMELDLLVPRYLSAEGKDLAQ